MMFRAFTLALIVVILIIFILYLNYLLLGQFFFCLFLAWITSISLKPYKNKLVKQLEESLVRDEYILSSSILYSVLKEIYIFLNELVFKRSIILPMKKSCTNCAGMIRRIYGTIKKKNITPFNDIWIILYSIVIYIGVFKVGVELSLKAYAALMILNFLVRLILTVSLFVTKKAYFYWYCSMDVK